MTSAGQKSTSPPLRRKTLSLVLIDEIEKDVIIGQDKTALTEFQITLIL